jgi:hypothetical protein
VRGLQVGDRVAESRQRSEVDSDLSRRAPPPPPRILISALPATGMSIWDGPQPLPSALERRTVGLSEAGIRKSPSNGTASLAYGLLSRSLSQRAHRRSVPGEKDDCAGPPPDTGPTRLVPGIRSSTGDPMARCDDERVPGGTAVPESLIFDPSAARPGSFFALLEEKILTDQVATAATEAFGGADGYERARQESRGMSSVALAREYVAGFDGYLTGLTSLGFKQLNLAPDAAKHVFHNPDGTTDVVPAPKATSLSLGSMRIAAEILRGREPPVQIARTYRASVEGDCPFLADGIELAQPGFLVDGVRNGRLLLAGAIGATQATFLALEARYATGHDAGGGTARYRRARSTFGALPSRLGHAPADTEWADLQELHDRLGALAEHGGSCGRDHRAGNA